VPIDPIPTPHAVTAIGPYSSAVRAGDWIVLSGQIPIDPATGKLVDGDLAAQARQLLATVVAVLGDCGAAITDIAKTTIYLTDLGDFPILNEVYAHVMGDHRPARATVGAAALPLGAQIEMEAWVYAPR
jgi:2-iminobutanoate/2-iminopropanoate deaminase